MTISVRGGNLKFTTPMMRGPSVRVVQQSLIRLGHLPIGSDDGLFGSGTRQAVRQYQDSKGLDVDGIVGTDTAAMLDAVLRAVGDVSVPDSVRLPSEFTRKEVDPNLLPDAQAKRVILHWTGGTGRASDLDKKHYHFLIEQDGTIVSGLHRIDANDLSHRLPRASHTLNLNTHSVGISMCGMHGATERDLGQFPLREIQVEGMAALVAQICARYDIPVTRDTVLGHGEVQSILNVAQRNKWDPLVLPWRRALNFDETGDYLRDRVRAALVSGQMSDDEDTGGVQLSDLIFSGTRVEDGIIDYDTASWVRLALRCTAMGWQNPELVGLPEDDSPEDEADGVLVTCGETQLLPHHRMLPAPEGSERELCVRVNELAEELELAIEVDAENCVVLRGSIGGEEEMASTGAPVRFATIRSGDTLSALARRELGDSSRWAELRDEDGTHFNLVTARKIKAGQRVMLPASTAADAPAVATSTEAVDKLLTPAHVRAAAGEVGAVADSGNKTRAANALPGILKACYRFGVTDLSHIGYVLATAQHECNFGHPMEEKWTNSERQKRYEHSRLNEKPGDGKRYKGRGYVQLTFRHNYRRYGEAIGKPLEAQPELATDLEIAAEILVFGMSRMGFTGPRQILRAYGIGDDFDFDRARKMINGDRLKFERRYNELKGVAIGNRARKFRDSLAQADLPMPS